MAYDDKELGRIFPVRHGEATGTANERKMLDVVNDTSGIRTRIQVDGDGSKTMLRTKNGMPQFTREKAESQQPETITKFYMETGQLKFQYPGEFVATRLDPATIKFLDIPTNDEYLCYISGGSLDPGEQKNTPALSEGMNSLAIGYKITGDPTTDSTTRDEYKDALVLKKIMSLSFQSSMFSGKMRLFLQSQFGAKMEKAATGGFYLDVFGDTLHLKYSKLNTIFQFGYWPHKSAGLFSADDNTWWVIDITGGPNYAVTAYKVNPNEAGKKLLSTYKNIKETISIPEREKLEGYIFAHSVIDVDKPVAAGTFTATSGFTLAYGWKFTRLGNKASIVLHTQTGGVGTTVWNAFTLHLTISYSAGTFSCSCIETAHGAWTDGWGTYNIFAPVDELGGELISKSVAMDTSNVMPAFVFSPVPIYGWYDDSDVWTPIVIGRSFLGSSAYYEQEQSGLVLSDSFSNRYNPDYFREFGTLPPGKEWQGSLNASFARASAKYSNAGASHSISTCHKRASMSVSIGSWAFYGERTDKTTQVTKSEIVSTEQGWVTPTVIPHYQCTPQSNDCGNGNHYHGGSNPASGDGNYTGGLDIPGSPPMIAIVDDVIANYPTSYYNYYTHWTQPILGVNHVSSWNQDESIVKRWTVVIPTGDCSAAYVATQDANIVLRGTITTKETKQFNSNFLHVVVTEYLYGGEASFVEYSEDWAWVLPFPNGTTVSSASIPTTPENPPEIKAWNTKVSAMSGEFSHSPYMLFNVDYRDPTYPSGMTMHTSFNLRYNGSEVDPDPSSVESNYPFVGWA